MAIAAEADSLALVDRSAELSAHSRSLADVLSAGPLPLPLALEYAKGIASGAAVFHRRGRAYGALSPSRIVVGADGPTLPEPNGLSRLATPSSDLRDFGLLLHQMLTGLDAAKSPPTPNRGEDVELSPSTVRSAALRLAERCRSMPGQSDLRRVATELRLLQIMMNSLGPDAARFEASQHLQAEQPAAHAPSKPVQSGAQERECPSCGSPDIHPAGRLTILEQVLAVADLKTYRCHRCCRRFINVFGLFLPRPENE